MSRDPYKYFRIEARELLEQLGKAALDMEKSGRDPEAVSRLLRAAHTIKGAARVVKAKDIADLAHALEDRVATPGASSDGPETDALLRMIDAMSRALVAIDAPPAVESPAPHTPSASHARSPVEAAASLAPTQARAPQPSAPASVSARSEPATPTPQLPRSSPREPSAPAALHADSAEMDALFLSITEAHSELAALRRDVVSLERARHMVELLLGQVAAPRLYARDARASDVLQPARGSERFAQSASAADALSRAARGNDGSSAASARGSDDRDGPAQLGTASTVAALQLRSLAEDLRSSLRTIESRLLRGTDQIERELRGARAAAEKLWLLPASSLFHGLERTLRDGAALLHKRARLATSGGELRVDAGVLGAVQPALVQLVRNALAHGIEAEPARIAAGKNAEGVVTVHVTRRDQRIVFACQDDGRGVDLAAVRRAAKEKGLLLDDQRALGSDALLELLMRGRISTADTVTPVAGRGVGLDVVHEVAVRLGASVAVHTEPGRGTTIELSVPVSRFSIEVLIVQAGELKVAVPLETVVRSSRLAPDEITDGDTGATVFFEQRAIAFAPLATQLGGAIAGARAQRSWSAIIVRAGDSHAALGVDRLLGAERIVLRPLPALTPASAVIAGTALDAVGMPLLVVDAVQLVAAARGAQLRVALEPASQADPILVIDDSLTTRMLEQSILESAGYEVETATSAEEGMERARQRKHRLFLVDVEMPGMDGFTFVEKTRADPELRDTPAILVTSRNAPEDKLRGETAGASAYIVKGEFNQGELLARIRELLGS